MKKVWEKVKKRGETFKCGKIREEGIFMKKKLTESGELQFKKISNDLVPRPDITDGEGIEELDEQNIAEVESEIDNIKELDVSAIDGTQMFLNQAHQYPVLSAEEERELFRKYKLEGDLQAKEKLVLCNLKLAIKAAFYYYRAYQGNQIDDLIQSANMGILTAVEKFDISKGCKFSTYAVCWIRNNVRKECQSMIVHNMASINNQAAAQYFKIKKYSDNFYKKYGVAPTLEEISKGTSINIDKIKHSNLMTQCPISLENTLDDNNEGIDSKLEFAAEPDPTFEKAAKSELILNMEKLYNKIDLREYDIIARRYGLDGRKEQSVTEIANSYHLTRERIRQIAANAISKMAQDEEIGMFAAYLN